MVFDASKIVDVTQVRRGVYPMRDTGVARDMSRDLSGVTILVVVFD